MTSERQRRCSHRGIIVQEKLQSLDHMDAIRVQDTKREVWSVWHFDEYMVVILKYLDSG